MSAASRVPAWTIENAMLTPTLKIRRERIDAHDLVTSVCPWQPLVRVADGLENVVLWRLGVGGHVKGSHIVAVPAVLDDRDVDVDDVPVLQRAITRDAVADDVIDRRADGFRKAAVVERCGNGAVVKGVFDYKFVEPISLNAWLNIRHEHVDRGSGKLARFHHACISFGPMNFDLGAVGCDVTVIKVVHRAGPIVSCEY